MPLFFSEEVPTQNKYDYTAPMEKRDKQFYFLWCVISFITIVISTQFTMITKENADKVTFIEGVSQSNGINDYHIIYHLTKATIHAKRLAVYLNIYDESDKNHELEEKFALESVIDVKIGNTKSRIHRSYSSIPYGRTELMTTTASNISLAIGQVFLTGVFRNTTKMQILEIHNSKEFERLSYIVSKAFSFECSIVLFIFAFLVINNTASVEATQVIGLILMTSTTISLLLFNNYHSSKFHLIELFFKGETQSLTYLVLFTISTTYMSSTKVIPTLVIGVIFIISDGVFMLTSDSIVLGKLFDNNDAVWIFFFVTSIIFKITMMTMTLHHLLFAYFQTGSSYVKTKIFVTVIVLVIVSLPRMITMAYIANENISTSSIAFLSDYIIQAVGSILIIGLVWPTIDYDASSGANIIHATSQEDLVELFGDSQIGDL